MMNLILNKAVDQRNEELQDFYTNISNAVQTGIARAFGAK